MPSLELRAYLNRIGYVGDVAPTLDVLREVHRCHACAIAYENLDVIRRVPVDQNIERIFDKIVGGGRGGWCYEMNGLLGWALREIGFEVSRLCGGVMRAVRGDGALGNHLVLQVQLNAQQWIADVGLGDGLLEPVPLAEGSFDQFGRRFALERLAQDEWRFHNRENALPPSFDFIPGDEARLSATCEALQSDPESMFRQNLVCQRMRLDGGHMLLGRVLTPMASGAPKRLLESEAQMIDVLENVFGLAVPDVTGLWDRVVERHRQLFGDTPAAEIRFGPPPAA